MGVLIEYHVFQTALQAKQRAAAAKANAARLMAADSFDYASLDHFGAFERMEAIARQPIWVDD